VKLQRVRRTDRPLIFAVQQRHPLLKDAVLQDFFLEHRQRGGRTKPTSKPELVAELVRLIFVSDAFGAMVLYRLKTTCQRRGIPVLPRLFHRGAMMWAQLTIGDPVLIHPGVRLAHGQVVIDGFVEIHPGVVLRPFVTIGLREGEMQGPTLGRDVKIGTGAKVIGPVTVGDHAVVGANSLVLHDVAPGAVVAGSPARPLR
jgi:serine O-acetyltransferase